MNRDAIVPRIIVVLVSLALGFAIGYFATKQKPFDRHAVYEEGFRAGKDNAKR